MDNEEFGGLFEELDYVCEGWFFYNVLCDESGFKVRIWNDNYEIVESSCYLRTEETLRKAIDKASKIIDMWGI